MTPNSSFANKSAGGAHRSANQFFSPSTRQHLVAGAVAVLFAASAFRYGGNPPEITAAISLSAWWGIVLGAATGLLPIGNVGRRAAIALALVAALTALTALSITWSIDEGRAFAKTVQMTSYLGLFVLALFCSPPGSARKWIVGITAGLFFIVVLGALGRFLPGIGDDVELTANLSGVQGRLSWPLGYWNALGAAAAICGTGLAWLAVNSRTPRWRALAVAGIPLTILVIYLTSSRGAFVALGLSLLLLIAFGPRRRTLIGAVVAAIVCGGILILIAAAMSDMVHAENTDTAEQQGFFMLVITIVLSGGLGLAWGRLETRLRDLAPWKPPLWQWIAGGLLVLVALVAVNPVQKVDNFLSPVPLNAIEPKAGENTTTSHLLSSSGTGRSEYWETAIEAFEDEPVRGIGAGSFETYYQNERESGLQGRHTHSLPLQVLGELGLAGAVLVLALVLLAVVTGWQRWQTGQLSTSVLFSSTRKDDDEDEPWETIPALLALGLAVGVSLAIDWTAEFPAIAAVALIVVACLVGPATRPDVAAKRDTRRSLETEILAVLAILAGGVCFWVAASGFGYATNLNSSRDAVSDGDYTLAAEEARDAIEILPNAAEPRVQLALVQEIQGRYRLALRTLEGAINRNSKSSAYYLLKARLLLEMDRRKQSLAAYEVAKSLDPKAQIFAFDLEKSASEDSGDSKKKPGETDGDDGGIVDSSRAQP